MAERPLCMRQVRGSMPLSSTFGLSVLAFHQHTLGDVAQMVERVLSMHEAMGSMPIFSTHTILFSHGSTIRASLHWVRSPACDDTCIHAPLAQSAERRSHNPKPSNTLLVVLQQS